MNSKLRNSLSAITASAAALALALMVAVPGNPPALDVAALDADPVAGMNALTEAVTSAEQVAASALTLRTDLDTHPETEALSQHRATHKGSRHRRQTVVMPYFSFSPRG